MTNDNDSPEQVEQNEHPWDALERARREAYADAMRKLNSVDVAEPWTFPAFTEVDDYGLPSGGHMLDRPDDCGAPSQ